MSQPLSIAFIWHMHQPYYRDLVSRACSMPWVRLHATKDYLDMVKRLQAFPSIHQTFNLVPSLLDQLEEYLPPASRTDVFFDLSQKRAAHLSEGEQRFVLQWFFLANADRMIKPYPRYDDLLAKRGAHVSEEDWPAIQKRFRVQDYLDLQVWFNLAWIDPWLRSQDPQLAALEAKGSHFTEEEKATVLESHLRLMAQVIPAYREAAARGQIELTTSPYYHPILPLLCDLRSASAALPHLALPEVTLRRPQEARWHLQQGLARHQAAFGVAPAGLWPSEGSVSEEVVKLAIESRVRWFATDEAILWRTLKSARSPSALYRPHLIRRKEGEVAMVFRDRELSDLVGFVYGQWDAKPAVADFLDRLGSIQQQVRTAHRPALVSIILDGENAWEYYPGDGHEFFMELYSALASDQRFRCVTVSEFLASYPFDPTESLPELFSGSWIDGNFATWVGHPEKNAAWIQLAAAQEALSGLSGEDPLLQQAWKSVRIAQGSDWMWWFGDTHFSAQAEEFDRLFRLHLSNGYHLAGLDVPAALQSPIKRAVALPLHKPTGMIHPMIDGRDTSYYEWLYAGSLDLRQQYSAIQRGEQCLQRLYYGFDRSHWYLRIDLDSEKLAQLRSWTIDLGLSKHLHIEIMPDLAGAVGANLLLDRATKLPCALGRILELAIPLDAVQLNEGNARLVVTLSQAGEALERYPFQGAFELNFSATDMDAQAWSV